MVESGAVVSSSESDMGARFFCICAGRVNAEAVNNLHSASFAECELRSLVRVRPCSLDNLTPRSQPLRRCTASYCHV